MARILYFILVSFCLASLSNCSSYSVIPVDKTQTIINEKRGIYYSLPKTVVNIELLVKQNKKLKGPYSEFAEKYLALTNVIKDNSTTYNISDVKITTTNEADQEQIFFVNTDDCKNDKNKMKVFLANDGVILSVNETPDIISNNTVLSTDKNSELATSRKVFNYLAEKNINEKIDTIIEKINIDTVTIEKKILRKTMLQKTIEQKAREAADYIMKVKENKYNLIIGFSEVNYQKETIAFMKEELEKSEKEYLTLFTGDTLTRTVKYTYTYIPKKSETKIDIPLCKFSSKDGVLGITDARGDNIYINIDKISNNSIVDGFINFKDTKFKEKKKGFYYRIPAFSKIILKTGSKSLADENFYVNQLGTISHLPHKMSKIVYYQESGAIKRFEN